MNSWNISSERHDEVGQFTVLDGVCVRVGEKFKPLKQDNFDHSFTLADLSKFTYEFSLEKKAIDAYEADVELERLQLEEAKQLELNNATAATTANDTGSIPAGDADDVGKTTDNSTSDTSHAMSSATSKATQDNRNSNWMPSTILEPTKLYGHPGLFEDSYSSIPRSINISEFEDNNATPFELVEMQSINEFDELMSVLQPGAPSAAPRSMGTASNIANSNGPMSSSRNSSQSPVNIQMPLVDCSDNMIPDSSSAALLSMQYSLANTGHIPYVDSVRDISGSVPQSSYSWGNPSMESLSSSKNSKSLPDLATIGRAGEVSDSSTLNCDAVQPGYASNAFATPYEGELQERSLSAGSRIQAIGKSSYANESNQMDSEKSSLVATNRINNIMSQYRFTRLNAEASGNSDNQPISRTDDVSPWQRSGVLPPISSCYQSIGNTLASSIPLNSVVMSTPSAMANSPRSNLNVTENIHIDANRGQPKVSYCKQPVALPPIKQQQGDSNEGNVLANADGYSSLTSEEQQFATDLTSMGFPPGRVVRALGRHGCKDKEVVDFLLLVQQLSDLGHNEFDVEIVLSEVNNNFDQAVSYLQTVHKLADLGFPNQRVIDALKTAKGDSDAALEVLMS